MKNYQILAILLLMFAVYSCRKDSAYVPQPKPSATPVKFSTQIAPILTTDCAKSTCHDATTKKMGLDFSSATTAYTTLFAKNQIDTVANKSTPELNKLYVKISPGKSMEKYLSNATTQRDLILTWLKEGAKNN